MLSLTLRNDFLQISEKNYQTLIAVYNMTDRMVQESMESIQSWYKMQPHFPQEALSDDCIFRHLLAVGFSLEKAKMKIDNRMTACAIMPELLQNRDPCAEWAHDVKEYMEFSILPQQYQEQMRIFFSFTDKDTSDFNMVELHKFVFLVLEYRLCNDLTLGEVYIVDLGKLKLGHIVKLTPALIKKTLFLLQSCFSAKIKGLYYINVPSYADYAVTLFKAGLSKKVADRFHVYRSHESLHKIIPKSMLPKEMGGDNKSLKELADATFEELCQPRMRQWFIEQDKFKTDESKRRGAKSDMSNELLGMQGSFRTLDID